MKYVVITGAYGGMGYKTAKILSEKGYTIFALDKTVSKPEKNIIPIKTDISNIESIKNALKIVENTTNKEQQQGCR